VIDAADVYATCALGGVIKDHSIERLRVKIVADGANNQLEDPDHGDALRFRGILYAPDYVINAGGMVELAMERLGHGCDKPSGAFAISATRLPRHIEWSIRYGHEYCR
jgi:leucine dehydrogenase